MISTRQVAKKLGLSAMTLSRYIAAGKIPAPQTVMLAGMRVHSWTEEDIEGVRAILPKIANGRKTRWQKQREAKKKKRTKSRKKS